MDCISVTNQRHGLCMNVWKAPYLLVTENCEQEKKLSEMRKEIITASGFFLF